MQLIPFKNMPKCTFWEFTFNYACMNMHCNFILTVFRVKMWRRMIIPVHGYDDSEKSAYYRHIYSLIFRLTSSISRRKKQSDDRSSAFCGRLNAHVSH